MTALCIIGGVLVLIGFMLLCSVRAYVEYSGDFSAKVKYLFVTLYDSAKPPKAKKKKRTPKNIEHKKKPKAQAQSPNSKQSFTSRFVNDSGLGAVAADVKKGNKRSFDFEMLKLIYDAAKSPLKRLIRRMRVEKVSIDCIVGGEDAALVALNYGFQSAAVSGGLAWLNEIVTLKVKRVNVVADFAKEKTDIKMKCRVKLRLISAVAFVAGYLLNNVKSGKGYKS